MIKWVTLTLTLILCQASTSFGQPLSKTGAAEETTTTTTTEEPKPIIPIIKDERDGPLNGDFTFDFETGDGIKRTEEGNSQGVRTGVISFPLPNGETFELKFKAGPNGFQPESSFLPKAPEFPHEIPPHALEQLRRHGR